MIRLCLTISLTSSSTTKDVAPTSGLQTTNPCVEASFRNVVSKENINQVRVSEESATSGFVNHVFIHDGLDNDKKIYVDFRFD